MRLRQWAINTYREHDVVKLNVLPGDTVELFRRAAPRHGKFTHLRARPFPPVQLLYLAAYKEFFCMGVGIVIGLRGTV